MHDAIAWLIKHVPLIQWLYQKIMSLVFRIMGAFITVDEKLVLLSSYGGDQYSDSPKVLFETMREDPRFEGYRYVWAFADPSGFGVPGTDKVKIDTLSYFKTALAAKVWITNVNIERGLHFKKKSQVYLNTWHGTGPKKGGNAVKGRKDYDFSYVDIVCVDGTYARDEMIKWFNAKEEHLLFSGRPREDELFTFDGSTTERVRKELNIPDGKKVLLYMPTWREYGNLEPDTALWEQELCEDYVVLVRAHHFAKKGIAVSDKAFWVDVSAYPDVNELYWVADVLISDYSSAFFDFGLLGKPMVCFGYDYEQYEAGNGFLMDLKNEFPNGIKRTEEEVLSFIKDMDYKAESSRCKAYVDGYVKHPGNATQMCIDRICECLAGKSGTGGGDLR